MPWWIAILIGTGSVCVFEILKAVLKKSKLKPLAQTICAFALTMGLTVAIAFLMK